MQLSPHPALYHLLEAEGFEYAIRILANDVQMANISHLIRPGGQPSHKPKVFYETSSSIASSGSVCRRRWCSVSDHRDRAKRW